jgi:ABC-type lipoprotein release transport system permease subunit
MTFDPFETAEEIYDEAADEAETIEAKKERREKQKFYVVKIESVFESQKDVRSWLEANESSAADYRIVKGMEVVPKKKVAYYF